MTSFDVIIIGAGAAGMMCAATAGQRGRRVLLVDHATKLAEKIRISGGGRCNFTNLHCRPEAFLSKNPHFARSALSRYTQHDFIKLVERHGIGWHEKTLGQLFCDESAKQIIQMLKMECDRGQVQWAVPAEVANIRAIGDEPKARYEIATSKGEFRCTSLVIASGGLSIPKIGATPFGYKVAEQFGLPIVPPKPALVPLALPPEWLQQFGELSGSSFDTIASVTDAPKKLRLPDFRESALITHRGLSGPAILQVSSYWQQQGGRGAIALNLLPGVDVAAWIAPHRQTRSTLGQLLAAVLPKRVAENFAVAHGWTQPLAECSNAVVAEMAATLGAWRIQPSGTLGYDKAEVTLGGVDTDALSQQTMEAKSVPGLFFIGEVVDVTGWLGGYNFQWAWSSAVAAGEVA
ncbi:MAG: NAD(P)/FAD-dependent oxidoreductase [Betaproteobacteria bacterium]|nr:NAD(P)/FAD-dependent oxidoreductase [Betaproteobacteria bacterium]